MKKKSLNSHVDEKTFSSALIVQAFLILALSACSPVNPPSELPLPVPHFTVQWAGSTAKLYYSGKQAEHLLIGDLDVIKAGNLFYHWGPKSFVKDQSSKGYFSKKWMRQKIQDGFPMVQGGGFYVSFDIWNCENYGTHLMVVEAKKDLLVAKSQIFDKYEKFWGTEEELANKNFNMGSFNRRNLGLERAGVHGTIDPRSISPLEAGPAWEASIHETGDGWLNLIHADAVTSVREATLSDLFSNGKLLSGKPWNLTKAVFKMNTVFGFNDMNWISHHAPEMAKLIEGKERLTPDERAHIKEDVVGMMEMLGSPHEFAFYSRPSKLFKRMVKQFHPELREAFQAKLEEGLQLQTDHERKEAEEWICRVSKLLKLGVPKCRSALGLGRH